MKKVVYPVAALLFSATLAVPPGAWAQAAVIDEYIGSGNPLPLGPDAVFVPNLFAKPMPEQVANDYTDGVPCSGDCGGISSHALTASEQPRRLVAVPQSISYLRGIGVQGVGSVEILQNKSLLVVGATVFDVKPDSIQMTIYHAKQAIASCALSFIEQEASDGSFAAAALIVDERASFGSCDTDLSQPGQQLGQVAAVAGDMVEFTYSTGDQKGVPFFVAELFEQAEQVASTTGVEAAAPINYSQPSPQLREQVKKAEKKVSTKAKKNKPAKKKSAKKKPLKKMKPRSSKPW